MRRDWTMSAGRPWMCFVVYGFATLELPACAPPSDDAKAGGAVRDETVAAALRRDSTVIDSIVRSANTDSLYRLYRTMLYAPTPAPIYQQIICESFRIGERYG